MATSSSTFVDLSHTLDFDVQIYPGDPQFSCCPSLTIAKDGMNVHALSLGTHTGTHIDAPYHFVETGAKADEIPLAACVGRAVVADLTHKRAKDRIAWADVAHLADALGDARIVLFRTGWSRHWQTDAYFDHPYLERALAERLVELGVKVVGTDTLSPDETRVDGSTPDFGVHDVVLGAGALIVENLTNLEAIQEGEWTVHLVPLKLAGCDGSPIRAYATRLPQIGG